QQVLLDAWKYASNLDTNMIFKHPVREGDAPGYHQVIKMPMDLSTIRKKILGGGYPSFKDFERDLELMWHNCTAYNAA
ncbi:unnamed protein product, partial [Discosporangium mesarthrocarpum]